MSTQTQFTLRTAVILPFVVIFLFTIGVIVAVQKRYYEVMVQDISSKQLSSLSENVQLELHEFLHQPFKANQLLSESIGYNQLYSEGNLKQVEKFIYQSFDNVLTSIPQIDVVSFGGEGADYVGFRKEDDDSFTLMLQDDETERTLVIYQGDSRASDPRSVFENYDPRVRPWYAPVAEDRRPQWSSIYTNADERQEITLSAQTATFAGKEFVGVVVTDIKIDTFNAFLRNKQQDTQATLYVFDKDNRLVAHSSGGSVVSWGTDFTPKGDRLLTHESASPIVTSSSQYIEQQQVDISSTQRFVTHIEEERYFHSVTPFIDEYGLEWYIGVSMSESALLGELPQRQLNSWLYGLMCGFLGIILGLVAFNRITNPITSTANAAKHLAKGDWDGQLPKPGHIYETSMLVDAFNEMANNLKTSFKALRSQLLYDSLTKLYSREGFIDTCDNLNKLDGCLMLVGINQFRDINDSLGHYKGDQLLIVISERIKALFDPSCFIGRIGGDEFAIYIPEKMDQQQASLMSNRLLQTFASPFKMDKESVVINISIGVVNRDESTNMTLWLRNGSIALSNAKRELSRVSYYKPEMADVSRKRTLMQAKIKDALENDEFVPYYQPIVELKTGKVVGAEALARWFSPKAGLISPLDFIPVAEESGLIGAIGEQILTQACEDTMQGIKDNKWGEDFHLHVNLSVNQLSHPDFIKILRDSLMVTGLNPDNLTLEITESRIVDNDPVIIKNMQAIRDLGVHIAIDDFGTGYSSLAYLHKLPFNCLKIDRTFVNKLEEGDVESSVVAAIINMTKSMKVELVAEGIETEAQATLLNQLNCPYGQGFLYSRPVPFDEWPTDLVNIKPKSS